MKNKTQSHEYTFDYILEQLNRMFQLMDISKPICSASNIEDARFKSKDKGFTHIPITGNEKQIREYYDAKTDKIIPIRLGMHVVSDGIGGMEAIPLMSDKEFFFVLTGNEITRNIHFTDLNSPYISIGLYAKLNYLEVSIRSAIRKVTGNGETEQIKYLKANLSKKESNDIINHYFSKKDKDLHIDPVNELYINQKLHLARKLNLTQINNTTIDELKNMRNSLLHFSDIIRSHEDIDRWVRFLNESDRIIKNVKEFLNSNP